MRWLLEEWRGQSLNTLRRSGKLSVLVVASLQVDFALRNAMDLSNVLEQHFFRGYGHRCAPNAKSRRVFSCARPSITHTQALTSTRSPTLIPTTWING